MMAGEQNWWVWVLALAAVLAVALVVMAPGPWGPGREGLLTACEVAHPDWARTEVEAARVLGRGDELTVLRLSGWASRFTVCEGIAQRWLWEGMSESMAQLSWGPPHSIERTLLNGGERVQLEWLYDPMYMLDGGAVIRFVDGDLVNWRFLDR